MNEYHGTDTVLVNRLRVNEEILSNLPGNRGYLDDCNFLYCGEL